jgi:hypothetical protein
MKKPVVALITIIAAIALVSYSYASTNGINTCNGVCAVKFAKATTHDNEVGKDFGHVSARIIDCGQSIEMTITNGYPHYQAYLNYTIQNVGTLPIQASFLTITNPNPQELKVTSTDHTGTWLQPSQTVHGKTNVTILDTAKQGSYYTFKIQIDFACSSKYPRSKGFWQEEFRKASCGSNKGQISASTIESYLNHITAT